MKDQFSRLSNLDIHLWVETKLSMLIGAPDIGFSTTTQGKTVIVSTRNIYEKKFILTINASWSKTVINRGFTNFMISKTQLTMIILTPREYCSRICCLHINLEIKMELTAKECLFEQAIFVIQTLSILIRASLTSVCSSKNVPSARFCMSCNFFLLLPNSF